MTHGMIKGILIGAATASFCAWIFGNVSIDIPATDGYKAEFCEGQSVTLHIGGSRLDPRLSIGCPTRPCAGVIYRDDNDNIVSALVPGVPKDFDCNKH